jgi:hypothetical protein
MAMNADPSAGPPEPPMGEERADDDERLPCGRELAHVWQQWEERQVDAHTRGCPHCSAALEDLNALKDVVSRVREEEPAPDDASGLVERVMDVVHLELRPGRTLPLGTDTEDAWIVEAAAAKAFRAAADSLPGVRAGSCRIAPLHPAADARQRTRGPVRVRIEVMIDMTDDLPEAAEQVRRRLLKTAQRALGMEVGRVDVAIVDVLDGEGRGEGRSRWR